MAGGAAGHETLCSLVVKMANLKRYALHTVAAVDRNMGIGNGGKIPWPFIK